MKKLLFSYIIIFFSFIFSSNPPGWYIQYTPANGALIKDISFNDSLNGWAITTNGVDSNLIIKTTNGGINWFQQFAMTNAAFDRIQMLNNLTGYCTGIAFNGLILKTTNSGTNWIDINFPEVQRFVDCSFINPDIGWICDDAPSFGGLWRTTNGGLSWTRQAGGDISNVFFVDVNTGWYSAYTSLYKTTNSGINWNMQQNFIAPVNDIFLINKDTGWISGGEGSGLIKTTNGGNNWLSQNHPTATSLGKLFFLNKNIGWLGNNFNKLIATTNSGNDWGTQLIPTFSSFSIHFSDSINGGAGTSALIHTTDGGGPIVEIMNNTSNVPDKFILSQNYPNPFNPKTTINYDLKNTSYVSLRVYDINGKLVKDLVNAKQNPGSYKVEFNAEDITSGIYFYTLETEFGKITKKMLLIK